jgi:hypothetical protein
MSQSAEWLATLTPELRALLAARPQGVWQRRPGTAGRPMRWPEQWTG